MHVLPLSLVSAGVAVVALDLRIVHVDVLPDVLGWAMVAAGALRLRNLPAAVAGGLAALSSLPDLALSYHWEDLDPLTGAVVVNGGGTAYDQRLAFDPLTDVRAPLAILALVAGGAAITLLLMRLERRATLLGDHRAAGQLLAARLAVLLLWVFPHGVAMVLQWLGGDGIDPVWSGGLELVALLGLVVAGAVAVEVAVHRNRGWTATDDERATPWAALAAERLA